jgi:hypothetical protein
LRTLIELDLPRIFIIWQSCRKNRDLAEQAINPRAEADALPRAGVATSAAT